MPPPGGDKKYEKIGGPNAEEFILRGGKNNQEVIDWNFRATLEVVKGGIRSNKTGENFLQRRLLEVKSVRRLRLSDKMGLGDTNNPSAMEQGGEEEEIEEIDKVTHLKNQVDGVKQIMTQNVDRILARGERLDDLMDKSEDLQAGAQNFKQTSQKVARSYWWKNVKIVVVIIVIVLIIVLIIVLLATGVIPVSNPVPPPPTIKPPTNP